MQHRPQERSLEQRFRISQGFGLQDDNFQTRENPTETIDRTPMAAKYRRAYKVQQGQQKKQVHLILYFSYSLKLALFYLNLIFNRLK